VTPKAFKKSFHNLTPQSKGSCLKKMHTEHRLELNNRPYNGKRPTTISSVLRNYRKKLCKDLRPESVTTAETQTKRGENDERQAN